LNDSYELGAHFELIAEFFIYFAVFFEPSPGRLVLSGVNKLNSGFSRFPDDEFDNKAEAIILALTGNPNFANITPKLTAITAYKSALAMPDGAPRDTQVAATRATLSALLEQLARNLELTPNVTDAMLATTGFNLRKAPTFSDEVLPAPGNVRLKNSGVSGVVQVLFEPPARAKAFEVGYTLDPNDGPWTDGGTCASSRGVGLTGLTRTKDYWVRVRAIGANGAGAWSDPATILVA
jgi:hypothetical protein